MRLIVTHEQPDFDALASLALALELYPGSRATVQGAMQPALQAFLRLYRDQLDLLEPDAIDLDTVSELIVVDTADRTRIRPFDALIGRVPITLYDHHPVPPDAIPAGHGLTERVGATVTLLARELAATGTPVPAAVATLGLIGIHEDTGNLSFTMTTAEDHRAAAYLLDHGANLSVVRRFTHDTLDEDQLGFRLALRDHARPVEVAGRPVVLAAFEHPTYVAGVSGLVSELLETHDADAAVVVARMDDKTLVFARSNDRFDSAAALADAIGGAGHPGAAYGKTDLGVTEATDAVLTALAQHATPVMLARDLMTSPVRSVHHAASVAEAHGSLLLHGHNGMPVLADDGAVMGVISRRDIDRALRHGLGDSKVSGFMSRGAHTAAPETSLADLERLVVTHNIGRLPIVDSGGDLVGIVTRADLIAARHSTRAPTDHRAADSLLGRLPPRATAVLRTVTDHADGAAVYLVGGTVRDLLLGAGSQDLDLVVEGISAEALGTTVQHALGGSLACHLAFGTCTLTLDDGLSIDLAGAREEVYAQPGALPDVAPASLKQDLERRDYTINAMALRLTPPPTDLIDPFGGEDDLRLRRLRILHPLSFVEDPTRVLRGARLAGRLSFEFAVDTAAKAREVLASGAVDNVSRSRLRAELELTLAERRVAPALTQLEELGALRAMFGLTLAGAPYRAGALIERLDEMRRAAEVPHESYHLALLLGVDAAAAERHVREFNWALRLLETRARLVAMASEPQAYGDDDLEALDTAAATTLRAAQPVWEDRYRRLLAEPPGRKLRGKDVVALGLPPGPAVGRVLAEVSRARAAQLTSGFSDEVELARRLIEQAESDHGSQSGPQDGSPRGALE